MELCSNQPSPSSSAKAGRKPCFTRMEEVTLVEEYNKRRDLLEGKVFSKITLSRKRELWGEIACILNSMNPSIKRSTEEVRKKYKNIVQSAKRKRNASCRHQTEGGPTIPLSVAEDQIIRDMEGRLSRPSSSVETGLYFVMQENLASEEGSVPPDEMLTDENTGKNESNKSLPGQSKSTKRQIYEIYKQYLEESTKLMVLKQKKLQLEIEILENERPSKPN